MTAALLVIDVQEFVVSRVGVDEACLNAIASVVDGAHTRSESMCGFSSESKAGGPGFGTMFGANSYVRRSGEPTWTA